MTEIGTNVLTCPNCNEPLDAAGIAIVQFVVKRALVGSVTLQNPEGWRKLWCGHRIEVMVDKTGAKTLVQLRDRSQVPN